MPIPMKLVSQRVPPMVGKHYENDVFYLFNVKHKAHFSDLVSWVSICPSINDKSLSRPLGIAILSFIDNKEKMNCVNTVAAPRVIFYR